MVTRFPEQATRTVRRLLLAAFAWSIAQFLAVALLPLGSSAGQRAHGAVVSASRSRSVTLVTQYGTKVIVLAAIPVLVTALVAFGLRRGGGSRAGGRFVWFPIVGLLAYVMIAGFSIGLVALPVVALLAAAALSAPASRGRVRRRGPRARQRGGRGGRTDPA